MLRALFPLLAAAAVAGCTHANPDVPASVEDVPVPLGWERYDDSETKSYYEEHEKFRNAQIAYKRKGKAADIAAFYLKEMARHQWTPENAIEVNGEFSQTWLKEQERATVKVRMIDETDEGTSRATITIALK